MPNNFETVIFCPHCAQQIDLQTKLGHRRLLMAIALQAERYGTEIYCSHCGVGFVYTRLRPQARQYRVRSHIGTSMNRANERRSLPRRRANPAETAEA